MNMLIQNNRIIINGTISEIINLFASYPKGTTLQDFIKLNLH